MRSEIIHKKKIVVFSSLLLVFLLANLFLSNLNFNQNSYINDNQNDENDYLRKNSDENSLKKQDLTADNIYSGIGAPWNLTHYANRTDYNLPVSFSENSYDDSQGIPLYGWEGYKLNAKINNLYDERNWNNGTFDFGADNGYQAPNQDDSTAIPRISNNAFQNWSFYYTQVGSYTNTFSGNYIHNYNGQYDCLELRLDGDDQGSGWYGYNDEDQCWWNSSISIPRGKLVDSKLIFDLNPVHGNDRIRWYVRIYINDLMVFTRTTRDLIDALGYATDGWVHFEVPQAAWVNTSNVFSGNLEDSEIDIKVALEFHGPSEVQSRGGTPDIPDYQQVLLKDFEFITKAEVKPSQIGLRANGTVVNDIDWSKGEFELNAQGNNWYGNKVYINFSSNDIGILGSYQIYLKTDMDLYVIKRTPETVYEAIETSYGTSFSVSNNSLVNWETYAFVEVPEYYEETLMILNYPTDINITNVSDPQKPTLNILNDCDNSTNGHLLIPIINISKTPDGFWNFKGISPNYCESANIYNDVTGSWVLNSTFYSGDNINITAKISKSSLIENYIDQTQATLDIRFPNGSLWVEKKQVAYLDNEGIAYFNPFQIPNSPRYDYQTGVYEAIITWNNSYSLYLLNETGVIYKEFNIIHDSKLEPENGLYFIENIVNDSIINVKVSFKDKVNDEEITDAMVYAKNSTGDKLDFNEISPGYYLLEFDARKVSTGNNTLIIFANSTFYSNKIITITIDVIEETILTVNNDFITGIEYGSNFSLIFNYTKKFTPQNEITIDIDKDFSTNWNGDYSVKPIGDGTYNLTCNSSNYAPNIPNSFTITLNTYKYEAQEKEINVILTEISSTLQIKVNGTFFNPNDVYQVEVWQKINITAFYKDEKGNPIKDATVSVTGSIYEENLTFIPQYNRYELVLNASDLGQGIDILVVYAESVNFNPNSIPFIVQITENKTSLQIFINHIERTSIELPFNSIVNITARYLDTIGGNIENAILNLTKGYMANLIEDKIRNQYSIIINTNQLNIGVKVLELIAQKNNYETQTKDIRIITRKMMTSINTEDGEDDYEIELGESITLTLEILNLDLGSRIGGLDVSYDWKLEDGDFEQTSNGLYEAKLKDIPEGTYTITITVNDPSGVYDFSVLEITLTVKGPQEETTLFQILLVIAIMLGTAIAGYMVYYMRVGRYPKTVRKVRKYRRTLKKAKDPNIDIIDREKAFNNLYKENIGTTGLLKGKLIEEKLVSNKKYDKKSSEKATKSREKKASNKMNDHSAENPSKNKAESPINKTKETKGNNRNNDLIKLSDKKTEKKFKNLSKINIFKNNLSTKLRKNFTGKLRYKGFKKVYFLIFLLIFLIFNAIILNYNSQNLYIQDVKDNAEQLTPNQDLNHQGLDFINNENSYNGIGAPWNVTHFANRTDSNLPVSFTNQTYDDSQGAVLGNGWTGYNLNAMVKNLYDTRNWINGTFHFGNDDGSNNQDEDDDDDTPNWTFTKNNVGTYTNPMSGNYLDSSDPLGNNEDCLELRIDGVFSDPYWRYDSGDHCYWESTIDIPRGTIIDSKLKIDLFPAHIYDFNDIKVVVYINNEEVWSIGVYEIKEYGYQQWHSFTIPQSIWINDSNVYPPILDGNPLTIRIELRDYVSTGYHQDFDYEEYQQVLFDNLELILKSEVKPEQIGMKMNSSYISDVDWGKGTAEVEGSWSDNEKIYANFSSDEIDPLGGYDIECVTDLNLYARKETLDTVYEAKTASSGTLFSIKNGTDVNWNAYGYVAVPTGYEQSIMRVEVPSDVNIWWVSSPQQPNINRFSTYCSFTGGILQVPVSEISDPSKPNGFWNLKATSNNYIYDLSVYNDVTGMWQLNSTFLSGDYINIRANITKTSIIQSYIQSTQATLDIRFPNGNLWTAQRQVISPDSTGFLNFSAFQIPNSPGYDYQAGEYEAIVTWNNSHSIYSENETGIFIKKFIVIHDSILEPSDGVYYIADVVDDKIINIKVIFEDKENNRAIENALVYYKNATNEKIYFSELSPGLYSVEFDTTKAIAGNNTLNIFANSSFYLNQIIEIKVDITKQTKLTVDTNYVSVPSQQNFSIQFNYTELNSPETGIDTNDITVDWKNYTITRIAQGNYNLTCNSTKYEVNKLHTLIIKIRALSYEAQSIVVRVYVSELGSSLDLSINLTKVNNIYTVEVLQKINITARYEDSNGDHLDNANITLLGYGDFSEQPNQYTYILNASELGESINTLTILANKTSYNPQIKQFIVQITERKTKLGILLDNANITYKELPYNSILNLKAFYNDTTRTHIEDAIVTLFGAGKELKLTENKVAGYYSIDIAINQLKLGLSTLSIDANKSNYEALLEDVTIKVRKIQTEITTEDGEKKYEIRPGESFKLTIELNDLDFGGKITDAEVTYDADFGSGDLEEIEDGVYEVVLENIPEGSYSIDIFVTKEGGLYEFEDYKVTLVVETPESDFLLFLILFIIAASVSGALATYFIVYRYWLQYPKPVRKVRKYRRTLRKTSAPSVDIKSRKKAFNDLYKESSAVITGFSKVKIAEPKTFLEDKLPKKTSIEKKDKLVDK